MLNHIRKAIRSDFRARVLRAALVTAMVAVSAQRAHSENELQSDAAEREANLQSALATPLDLQWDPDFQVPFDLIKQLEKTLCDRFAPVPDDFAIRFSAKDLRDVGLTQSAVLRKFDPRQKTLGEILTAVCVGINPDRTAIDSADPRQIIVWTIAPYPDEPGRPDIILITSRHAAAKRGYKLPAAFLPNNELARSAFDIGHPPLQTKPRANGQVTRTGALATGRSAGGSGKVVSDYLGRGT